jgi:hypothetical protein
MNKNVIETPLIDPNYVSYEQFFDHDWCGTMLEMVRNSPLSEAVNALIVSWRSTNGAHILPRLM